MVHTLVVIDMGECKDDEEALRELINLIQTDDFSSSGVQYVHLAP